ncbi:excise [Gordonia phage Bantam]|uniref:Excise n=1 Tax=Gordonia phage Bantam TaxID=1887641 RepID=A0A1B3AYG3_9CAUD|nr:excisionase and transcriptional regulator [Gordonia phage Bantam]AOE43782.1 excise [Gordonia phage Bantam]
MTPASMKLGHTKKEAGAIVGVSEQTIQRLIDDGELGAVKVRGRTIIPDVELKAWFEALPSAVANEE